jgi:two-component system sensor histidine kinase KdpD
MVPAALSPLLSKPQRPPRSVGVLVAIVSVAAATAAIYPLKQITPVLSLGILYVPVVLAVAMFWGLAFGIATSFLSAAAFNFLHLPPVDRFTLTDERDWVALLVFVAVAIASGLMAELARLRSREAEQRRQEADMAFAMAQLLLGGGALENVLEVAGQCVAAAVGVKRATISLLELPADERSLAFKLNSVDRRIGTLLLPRTLQSTERTRIADRVVPILESILAAALHRAELQAEVVETAALRRSDELKTAVLRSVSHDLRTPLTAILMAATALDPQRSTAENVADIREQVLDAATRLWRLIEKLLDLSVLQAGRAEPRSVWYSVDEILQEAIEQVDGHTHFKLSVDPDMPLLQGDPAQLERAFVNVLENAARYCADQPVTVKARAVRDRIRVLIADQGPGIALSERERVFLPFYRAAESPRTHSGSGLGLAISRGFLELNGGRIAVESLTGEGTSFVVEFPLPQRDEAAGLAGAVDRVDAAGSTSVPPDAEVSPAPDIQGSDRRSADL